MNNQNTDNKEWTTIDFDLEAFKKRSESISVEAIATEAFAWLIAHVEDYLDNQQTVFRIYFPKEAIDGLTEMSRLYDFYQEIPELPQDHPQEQLTVEAIKHLHSIVAKVKDVMNGAEELKKQLFQRLIFYYDTKIQKSKDNLIPIIYDLEGYVFVNLFDYEASSMEVEVRKGHSSGEGPSEGVETIKKIHLPEGYVIEFTLHFWPAMMKTSFGL